MVIYNSEPQLTVYCLWRHHDVIITVLNDLFIFFFFIINSYLKWLQKHHFIRYLNICDLFLLQSVSGCWCSDDVISLFFYFDLYVVMVFAMATANYPRLNNAVQNDPNKILGKVTKFGFSAVLPSECVCACVRGGGGGVPSLDRVKGFSWTLESGKWDKTRR